MQNAVDILQNQAHQQGRGETSPLLLLRALDARQGTRISHLPMDQVFIQAWLSIVGVPFCQHQAQTLAALRRNEPVALTGGSGAARQTLHLFLHEMLCQDLVSCGLLLVPHEQAIAIHMAKIDQINAALGRPLQVAHISRGKLGREAATAHMLLTTPDVLHHRLLRHHDRAWRSVWERLRVLMLFDLDEYTGVALAHLSALLMRLSRLVLQPPALAATLAEVTDGTATLQALIGQQWRMVSVQDSPRPERTLAVWRSGADGLHEAAQLALRFQRSGYRVHMVCDKMEVPLILTLLGPHIGDMSIGPVPYDAQVLVCVGVAATIPQLRQTFEGSFDQPTELTLLVLGNTPLEQTLARLVQQDEAQESGFSLLNAAPPAWLSPPTNAYVASQHLLCAASERVISSEEVQAWQAQDMVARLERRKQLVRLPGAEETWQPMQAVGDPYEGFALNAAGGHPIAVHNEQEVMIDTLDPSAFDRWGYHGAAIPPVRGGYRVVDRDDHAGILALRSESQKRATFPLRRCAVTIREERDHRRMQGYTLAWGRVVCDEEIYGYREQRGEAKPVDQGVVPSLTTRWTAPAVWVDLPVHVKGAGQLVGWALVWALPFCVLGDDRDLVPAYDATNQRVYVIDAQPGGNGLSAWIFAHMEELLPFAYDVALDCRNNLLLEEIAHNDMDWLLMVLGGKRLQQQPKPSTTAASPPLPDPPAKARLRREEEHAWGRTATDDHEDNGESLSPPHKRPAAASSRKKPSTASEEGGRKKTTTSRGRKRATTDNAEQEQPAELPQKAKAPSTPSVPSASASTSKPTAKSTTADQQKPSPPAATAPPEPTSSEPVFEPSPDATAILERLQKLREQKGTPAKTRQPRDHSRSPASTTPSRGEMHFHAGDYIFCHPYGTGVVRMSRLEQGQEMLQVDFPEYGRLDIDPSKKSVRRLNHSGDDQEG